MAEEAGQDFREATEQAKYGPPATEYAKNRTPDQSGIPHHAGVDPTKKDPEREPAQETA